MATVRVHSTLALITTVERKGKSILGKFQFNELNYIMY